MTNKLYIMRGLPGSGKSTQAMLRINMAWGTICYCSADLFHTNIETDEYNWKPENVHYAHQWCQLEARSAMNQGFDAIIVDNTNIKKKDYQYYLDIAKQYDYEVEYLVSDTEWAWDVEECFKRNTHNVPLDVIQRMKDSYEPH